MNERIHFIRGGPRSGSTLFAVLPWQNLGNVTHHASEFDTRAGAIRHGQASTRHALQPHCLTLDIAGSTTTRDVDVSRGILQKRPYMGAQI